MTKVTTPRKRSTTTVRKTDTAAAQPAKPQLVVGDQAQDTPIAAADGQASAEDSAPQTDDLRKPELIDLVVQRSGLKKKDVKPVVEAMLAVLGETLSEGKTMTLQPLGKVMVNNRKDKDRGEVLTIRIRRSQQSADQTADALKTPLAEPGEDR